MAKLGLKTIASLSLSAVLLLNGVSSAFAAPKATNYTGYLIDSYCGSKGYDEFHKIDLKKSPEKHLTECLKMSHCMKAGLGISIKQSNGTYKFYKFDSKGSKLADDKIMMMTKKKFNNKIAVTGVMSGNTITISSVKEVK